MNVAHSLKLKCRDLFSRRTALLEMDQLVLLDHLPWSDRVRRVGFDRVAQVTMRRQVPWTSLAALWLGVAGPAGILLLIALNQPGVALPGSLGMIAAALGSGAVIVSVWQLICRQTRIHIKRGDQWYELRTITTPRRVNYFMRRFCQRIERAQRETAQTRDASAPSPEDATEEASMDDLTGEAPSVPDTPSA